MTAAERTERLLRLAVLRGDRLSAANQRAKLASVPWTPDNEPVSIWTRRLGRAA